MLPRRDLFFVAIQGILFLAFLWQGSWTIALPKFIALLALAIGISGIPILLISLLQLNRNLSPFPTPKKGSELITTGLYKYIRHPIYTGIILIAFGFAIYTVSIFRFIIAVALLILFYFKSTYEEDLLAERYADYLGFKENRGRFFPKI